MTGIDSKGLPAMSIGKPVLQVKDLQTCVETLDWELGSAITKEIAKYQDILNIQSYWFANTFEEAANEMAKSP